MRNSIPEVLNDEDGQPLLPSVVRYLPNGHAKIGYVAQEAQTTDPKNTIVSVKRFMGRGLKDIAYAENLPYDFLDSPGIVQLKTVAGVKSPVEVSAQILATLRQRAEDMPLLVHFLVRRFATRIGKRVDSVGTETMRRLLAYSWPGNVRELENVIERAVVLSSGPEISMDLLPESMMGRGSSLTLHEAPSDASLFEILEDVERRVITDLRHCDFR